METVIRERLDQLRRLLNVIGAQSSGAAREDHSMDEAPLRAELFSAEQMAQHGQALANSHVLGKGGRNNPLLRRLDDNEKVLIAACTLLTDASASKLRVAPAGEWLLDNLYLIEEQIRTARKHLPRSYSRELPQLASGNSLGLPRVYDLALEVIAHGDGEIDADILGGFVVAYQTVTRFTLGELWAIPIMLRLALIENLRRVGARVTAAHKHLEQAHTWADQMMAVAERDPKNLLLTISDMARSDPPITSPFVAELARCLQGHGPALALPLTWIEQRLAESSQTIESMVHAENKQRASDQVSVSNTINSLRYLGAQDWRKFVDAHSAVEQILLEDPSDHYRAMDFATRDSYRQVIDRLAKRSDCCETDIAQAAIGLARKQTGREDSGRPTAHVGFYLVDQGIPELEDTINLKRKGLNRLRRAVRHSALPVYLGAIGLMTLLFTAVLMTLADGRQFGPGLWVMLGLVAVLPASQLAGALTNFVTTTWVTPRRLPRLDFSNGLPEGLRTLVVVPSLLSSTEAIERLLESLEVCFLGNRDPQVHFGLLTDLCDSETEHNNNDTALVAQANAGIQALNTKYPGKECDQFFLFHRPRLWNSSERCWMGRERKRGKLADLNAALRGSGWHSFARTVGGVEALTDVRYVITLDTDTQMPRDAARELVGTMAHPLNKPCLDADGQRVRAGYGILQPRMAATLNGSNADALGSRYSQLFGSEPGIDPYTRSVSDVYQDLFDEGSFIGKGIYDVDAFEATLDGRFPDNRILSHDLLEGCHARSGLVSDVHFYERYPTRYADDMRRRARWIRGDWQILQWLLPLVPRLKGGCQRNPLRSLSRWKIADNLRRSVVPAALIALLIFGWLWVPQAGWWTLALLAMILLPPILSSGVSVVRRSVDVSWRQHLATVWVSTRLSLTQAGFTIACLPHEAWIGLSAIARSLWRMTISRRGLLEWQVAGESASTARDDIPTTYMRMWANPVASLVAVSGMLIAQPSALWAAMPVLLLWLAGPALAWWLSEPLRLKVARLSAEQLLFLRLTARKTWAYFDRFVNAETRWLPPDNYQETPGPVLAQRTSPTNIGLAVLANLSACDFGYITVGTLLDRTSSTFATMGSLERYQGHFYNWYDTQTLQPLPPRYVSSVDSGNLAGHLLTLRPGLLDIVDAPVLGPRLLDGLTDTLAMLSAAAPQGMQKKTARLEAMLATAPDRLTARFSQVQSWLQPLARAAADMQSGLVNTAPEEVAEPLSAFIRQISAIQAEVDHFAPWLKLSPMPAGLAGFIELDHVPTLADLAASTKAGTKAIDRRLAQPQATDTSTMLSWLTDLRATLVTARANATQRITLCQQLAAQATDFAAMNYSFLYDPVRHLLAIGYNVDDFRRDPSVYDLLASETRLCYFVAIAQGQLPQEAWFAMGRRLTATGGAPVLLSWSGSMFEYLMPLLVMPAYEGSLLDQTCRAAVARQIAYGKQQAIPWGISESGYHRLDAAQNYCYQAFGTPGLGLKRGLAGDAVVAPYASALALLVAPEGACANLQRLANDGAEGRYGFYEAVDYTPTRLLVGEKSVIVRSFMVHHQAMSLLALGSLLLGPRMQQRFESDPEFQATLLLLQERVPKTQVVRTHFAELSAPGALEDAAPVLSPIGAHTRSPEVQLLSNGRYEVMVTNTGGGYSRWKGLAVSRWREDVTQDDWGTFIYLRDVDSGALWSAAHQPTRAPATAYEAMFSEGRAEYRRRDHSIDTYTEIVVSPEDDIELRRVRLTNRSSTPRTIEITSYAEVVLADQAADMTQPGFGNLFVQTEILDNQRAILCTRRPRATDERPPWMFHLMAANGTAMGETSFETDRMQFIGRGRNLGSPAAFDGSEPLSGSAGSVLDPIVAIRCHVTLAPLKSTTIDIISGAAEDRATCMALISKYQDRHFAGRVLDIASTHSGVTLRQINASEMDAQLYRRLAGSVIYANARLRADASLLAQNQRGQSGLWGYAISGDLPIVLLKISSSAHIDLARQLIQCHAYWRLKGLVVDLVIWNEDHVGYRQSLQDEITGLIATGAEANAADRPGGIFVRLAEQISQEDRILLQAVARVIISDSHGSLVDQVARHLFVDKRSERLVPQKDVGSFSTEPAEECGDKDLILANSLGGFTADGREYVIDTGAGQQTPAPWVNVLANPDFGSVVSESGPGYTWRENAHEFRLTPWSSDAIGASAGEAFYLRDEDSGEYWSPTPQPSPDTESYRCRHGFGYTVYEHEAQGVRSELWVYVDRHAAVKFSVLKLHNVSGYRRRLSATAYVEWVLGDLRSKTAMHVVTEIDPASGALFARNAYNTEFAGRVAFLDAMATGRTVTGNRTAFIGRNRSLAAPDAMSRTGLSGRLGAGLDPCGAIRIPVDLAAGASEEVIFRLGAAADIEQARALALTLHQPGSARAALETVRQYWQDTLGKVQVQTPDASINVMANGWLLYQTLACRIWARSGYYQSGGAFGFRDQLQDGMALVHAAPDLVREHLLRAAERQYPEGDVQHWWHPPNGRGVRTRCSDDYLWLPASVCRYVHSTGDQSVLDENLHFLQGRPLDVHEESYYELPGRAAESASLYQHCVRSIEHGLRMGRRGLPLMGSGDWNDGMNLVGLHGEGESVWLGFFLYKVLQDFAVLAADVGDHDFAERCVSQARALKDNIKRHAWDGAWYRRAWFDDGTALGSSTNTECTIDSIAQSWSVLSGGGDPERSVQAMNSVNEQLVRRGAEYGGGLIQLLDPPFDKAAMNPGYIKGYVPGVRENGGQYTHAAVWTAMAFAQLGDTRRAWELMTIINPVNHALSAADIAIYKTEPYALAADVYAAAPHTGRGGWSWYTGAAGWSYRLIVESLLGLRRTGDRLQILPCVPTDWPGYTLDYSYGETVYHIEVTQTLVAVEASKQQVTLDGTPQSEAGVTLTDDGQVHIIQVGLQTAVVEDPVKLPG